MSGRPPFVVHPQMALYTVAFGSVCAAAAYSERYRRNQDDIDKRLQEHYHANMQDQREKMPYLTQTIRGNDMRLDDTMNRLVWGGKANTGSPAPGGPSDSKNSADSETEPEENSFSSSSSSSEDDDLMESDGYSSSSSSSEQEDEDDSHLSKAERKRRRKERKRRRAERRKKRELEKAKKEAEERRKLVVKAVAAGAAIGAGAVAVSIFFGSPRK